MTRQRMMTKRPRIFGHVLCGTLLVAGLGMAGTATAQSVACAANESQQNLDGGANPWTAGSTSYSASIGSGASAVTVTGSAGGGQFMAGYPVTETGNFGGIPNTFGFKVDRSNNAQSNTITYTFSKPVNNLVITAGDIDRYTSGGTYADMVTVTGTSPTGATVNPVGTAASNLVTVNGTTAYPSGFADSTTNCQPNDNSCNVEFDFSTPIMTLTVVYANRVPPAAGDPPGQEVSLSFGGFCVQNPNPGITKAAPASATIGTAYNYSLQASNPGSASAPIGVQVNDTIDASKATINSIAAGSGWSCARVPNSAFPITTGSIAITCTSTAAVTAGATGIQVATINVTPTIAAMPGPISNTATIPAGSGGDISTANNSSTTVTTLSLPLADLSITKSNGSTSVVSGGTTKYVIRVTNNGPTTATGAILTDPVATGLTKTAVACSGTPGQCTAGTTPTVAQLQGGYALPALASGQFYEITVTCNVN